MGHFLCVIGATDEPFLAEQECHRLVIVNGQSLTHGSERIVSPWSLRYESFKLVVSLLYNPLESAS